MRAADNREGDEMKCPYCGAMIEEGTQFCGHCGNRLVSMTAMTAVQGYSPAAGGEAQTSGKAIASLVLGILIFIPFSAIAAVILGHLALSEIRKSAGRLKGQGLATVGLILGYAEIAMIPVILIIAAIAIPNLLRARMAANEAASLGSLRVYNTAIVSYAEKCPQQGYPVSVQSLGPGTGDCDGANLVDRNLGSAMPIKSGYAFHYSPGAPDEMGRVMSYEITADPVQANTTGTRHFFTDQTGVIRWAAGVQATEESPPLQ